jgi:hypothetical protein
VNEPLARSSIERSQIFKPLLYRGVTFVFIIVNSTAFKLRNDPTFNARYQKMGVVISLSPREIFSVKNLSPYVLDTKSIHKILHIRTIDIFKAYGWETETMDDPSFRICQPASLVSMS